VGRRGPLPIDPVIVKMRGNPSKRALRSEAAVVRLPSVALEPPADLSEVAAAEWRRLAPVLQAAGLLTPLDAPVFEIYCEAVATRQALAQALAVAGAADRPSLTRAVLEASQWVNRLAREFGMTPASRSRVRPAASPSRFADLVG
jgi:P27 family predicted phage terminase small subunit